jgi:hypothetical protein
LKIIAGKIPIRHSSGVINPGQFAPISFVPFCFSTGIFHHILNRNAFGNTNHQFNAGIAGLEDASPANGAGTKITEALAPVAFTASSTVLKHGTPQHRFHLFPGEMPPTMLVP